MRVLFIGPPLFGLLFPVISFAQAFRISGHEVMVASAGRFARQVAEAGLMAFDAAPELDSEAEYRSRAEKRKQQEITGNFSFFSDEMADLLVEFTAAWQPDLIIYPPLAPIGPMLAAKFSIPAVMLTVGFAHTPRHTRGMNRTMQDAYARHAVKAPARDFAWIDVTPPSMTILQNSGEPVIPMQYVPYNGGAVSEAWWQKDPSRKRILVSLGTVKPMVDGLDLITWVMDSASEIDAEIVLHISNNARTELRSLPENVRLVDWISMGMFLSGADGFIHHGGAGNTLTALHAGIPQIIFGVGADRPVNARAVVDRGCGIMPGPNGLSTELIRLFLQNPLLKKSAAEVAEEMSRQPSPAQVVQHLSDRLNVGGF